MPKKNEEKNLEENKKTSTAKASNAKKSSGSKKTTKANNEEKVSTKKKTSKTDNTTDKKISTNKTSAKSASTGGTVTSATSKKVANEKNKTSNSSKNKTNSSKTTKSTDTTTSTKKTASTKETPKVKAENKSEEKVNEKKAKEATIIEKIKSFISKIVAMQEEAQKEDEAKEKAKIARKTKKSASTKKEEAKEIQTPPYLTEYYDLPYRYNETVVKILAQTPKRLFVYWDVSDADKIRYKNAFGEDFFSKTYPVLLLHNDDKDYVTEIPINDFANSWYIDINDPKTKYTIQLGRKFREIPKTINVAKMKEENIILRTDYLPIAESNKLEVPNDHILFEKLSRTIKFRNVKTYEEVNRNLKEFTTQFGQIYDVKDFYKEMYKEEIAEGEFDFNNPSSGGLTSSSSTFK